MATRVEKLTNIKDFLSDKNTVLLSYEALIDRNGRLAPGFNTLKNAILESGRRKSIIISRFLAQRLAITSKDDEYDEIEKFIDALKEKGLLIVNSKDGEPWRFEESVNDVNKFVINLIDRTRKANLAPRKIVYILPPSAVSRADPFLKLDYESNIVNNLSAIYFSEDNCFEYIYRAPEEIINFNFASEEVYDSLEILFYKEEYDAGVIKLVPQGKKELAKKNNNRFIYQVSKAVINDAPFFKVFIKAGDKVFESEASTFALTLEQYYHFTLDASKVITTLISKEEYEGIKSKVKEEEVVIEKPTPRFEFPEPKAITMEISDTRADLIEDVGEVYRDFAGTRYSRDDSVLTGDILFCAKNEYEKLPLDKREKYSYTIYTNKGRKLELTNEAGSGGESVVYLTNSDLVAKVLNETGPKGDPVRTKAKKEKIEYLSLRTNKNKNIIWPKEAIYSDSSNKKFVGYLMDSCYGFDLSDIEKYVQSLKMSSFLKKEHILRMLISTLKHIEYLHQKRIYIVDLNEGGFIIKKGERMSDEAFKVAKKEWKKNPDAVISQLRAVNMDDIYLVDTDSFQIDKHYCVVGHPEFYAPERSENIYITENIDNYAVMTLVFRMLIPSKNTGPYTEKGLESDPLFPGIEEMSQLERSKKGYFCYNHDDYETMIERMHSQKAQYWCHLPGYIRKVFYDSCFKPKGMSEREFLSRKRLTPKEWILLLNKYLKDIKSGALTSIDPEYNEITPKQDLNDKDSVIVRKYNNLLKKYNELKYEKETIKVFKELSITRCLISIYRSISKPVNDALITKIKNELLTKNKYFDKENNFELELISNSGILVEVSFKYIGG